MSAETGAKKIPKELEPSVRERENRGRDQLLLS